MTDTFVAAAFRGLHLVRSTTRFLRAIGRYTGLALNATYFVAARREPSGITVGKPGGLRRSAKKNSPYGSKVSGIGLALAVLRLAACSAAAEEEGRYQEAFASGKVYADCAANARQRPQGWLDHRQCPETALFRRGHQATFGELAGAGNRPGDALGFVSHAVGPSPLELNRRRWLELAETGNPFLILLNRQFEPELAPFKAPAEMTNAWHYRSMADRLAAIAFVAAEGNRPMRGRKDLVDHAVAKMDWMLDQVSQEGWWWRQGPLVGDPNVNRFTLGPLLDAVRSLRRLAAGEAAWPRWRGPLERAIDLQRRAYRGDEPWDWGGRPAGMYANQDLYYVLIMALSAELFERPADLRLAEEMLGRVGENLLPDGGLRYIGVTNESPVYHALNVILIARYLTLTGDPAARELLRGTANYWPLVLTAEGQPEAWSDVWWKQTWGGVRKEAVVVSAGGTGDPRVQWLMWQVLDRSPPADAGWWAVCCAPYWTGAEPGEPPPERFVVPDRNMRGLRGRDGSWYFGVGQGRGLRNTFVGGLITSPTAESPLLASFRGAQIDVLPEQVPWRGFGQWLSELDDHAGLALRPGARCAIGVRYTLQRGLINGWPSPETRPSPWQVTQVWRAGGDGHVGMVALEATADAPGGAVAGRIALGPQPPEQVAEGLWNSGPLYVRLYGQFGTVRTGPTPHYNIRPESAWHGVIMEQPLDGGARRGDRFVYFVWVGPDPEDAPEGIELLPDDTGWIVTGADGHRQAVVFNPTAQPQTMTIPWNETAPRAWSGQDGSPLAAGHDGRAVRITLEAGQCAIVE